MHFLSILSSLLLVTGLLLNWPKGAESRGYQNPEGYIVGALAIITAALALYNQLKKKNVLVGFYAPLGAGVLAAVFIFLSIAGKGLSFFDTGLYMVSAGAILLILAGLLAWVRFPRQMLLGVPALLLAAAGAWLGKSMISEEFADVKHQKADLNVNASTLLQAYDKDSKTANMQYRDKMISVSGRVSETEAADSVVNIKFSDTLTGSYIIFAFQQKDAAEAKNLNEGDSVSIKGFCSGGEYSTILEAASVNFQRSVLEKKF